MSDKIDGINQLDDNEPRWFAVSTRAKCEKLVAQQLGKKQVQAYVPIVKSMRKYTRKIRHVEKPLIGNYVFVNIVKNEYMRVLETENVIGFVKFSKNLLAIPDHEIQILRRIVLENDIELEAINGTVVSGDPIIIAAGPLLGLAGKVIKVDGKRKFVVELERMGFTLMMTIDAQFIQKTAKTI